MEPLERRALLSFYLAGTYPTGLMPSSVVAADLNDDGFADLAVADQGDDSVVLLLGQGDGTFLDAGSYAVGSSPASLAVGDFNSDSFPDLVTADSVSNSVSVLLGNGDGTFQSAGFHGAGRGPVFVAAGDFNNDGRADLVVVNGASDTITVLLGNGDGSFQQGLPHGVGISPVNSALGDFNHDGLLDAAVANRGGNSVSVLLGNGDGTFRRREVLFPGLTVGWLTAGDFDNDSNLDLVITGNTQPEDAVQWLRGLGNGQFVRVGGASCPVVLKGDHPALEAGDFNADGNLDVIRTNYGVLWVELGYGDGSFRCGAYENVLGPELAPTAVADLNQDGLPDLTSINRLSDTVSVLLNDGNWRGGAPGDGDLSSAPTSPRVIPEIPDLFALADLRDGVHGTRPSPSFAPVSATGDRSLPLPGDGFRAKSALFPDHQVDLSHPVSAVVFQEPSDRHGGRELTDLVFTVLEG